MLKVSEFLELDINPFLMGVFFSRRVFTNDNRYIYVYTYYKKSRVVNTKLVNFEEYEQQYRNILNNLSGDLNFWNTSQYFKTQGVNFGRNGKGQAYFVLENDIGITKEKFYNKLYLKLLNDCKWIDCEELTEEKKQFVRGFMELRGSIDTKLNYIPHDYFADSNLEIRKARILVDYNMIPNYVTNINFRELQHDYYSGIRYRNTQFRLNLWWYMENIGIINAYKAEIFAISRNISFELKPNGEVYYFNNPNSQIKTLNNLLDDRINFYFTNIVGHEATEKDILTLRQQLGFDKEPKSFRSSILVETIKNFTPDECVCCKDRYKIEDRTHFNPTTGRPYFEIHHVISLGKNKELDDEDNMVKLCTVCHATLKKKSATEDIQKSLIRDIFRNAPKTLMFAKNYFDEEDIEIVVDKVWQNLK